MKYCLIKTDSGDWLLCPLERRAEAWALVASEDFDGEDWLVDVEDIYYLSFENPEAT